MQVHATSPFQSVPSYLGSTFVDVSSSTRHGADFGSGNDVLQVGDLGGFPGRKVDLIEWLGFTAQWNLQQSARLARNIVKTNGMGTGGRSHPAYRAATPTAMILSPQTGLGADPECL